MRTELRALGTALGLAVFCGGLPVAAGAVVITQEQTFGPFSLQAPAIALTFDRFDVAAGTLEAVTISLEATITGDTTVRRTVTGNPGGQTPRGNTTRLLTLDLSSAGISSLETAAVDMWSTSFSGNSNNGVLTQTESENASVLQMDTEAVSLGFFQGLGTYALDLFGAVVNNITFPATNAWAILTQNGFASGKATVQYDYTPAPQDAPPSDPPPGGPPGGGVTSPAANGTPVPEPGTLLLLGLALAGCSGMTRRTRHLAG